MFKLMLLHWQTIGLLALFVPAVMMKAGLLLKKDARCGNDCDNVDVDFERQHATISLTDLHMHSREQMVQSAEKKTKRGNPH